jgi:catechol 2,3-dioxygenase-like lactoylglutathione lyase family enzyme
MLIKSLDHLVLTVRDISATIRFFTNVLGMEAITFANGRRALGFGEQKINLHELGGEIEPHAQSPTPGSADLCFLTDTPLLEAMQHVLDCGIAIESGPVRRTGATGPIESLYIRDLDDNLIEISRKIL